MSWCVPRTSRSVWEPLQWKQQKVYTDWIKTDQSTNLVLVLAVQHCYLQYVNITQFQTLVRSVQFKSQSVVNSIVHSTSPARSPVSSFLQLPVPATSLLRVALCNRLLSMWLRFQSFPLLYTGREGSLVPRPHPAFCTASNGKLGGAWEQGYREG